MKFVLVVFMVAATGCEAEDLVSEEDLMAEVCEQLGYRGWCDPIGCPAPFEAYCPEAGDAPRCPPPVRGEPLWMVGAIGGGCQAIDCSARGELVLFLDAKVTEIRRLVITTLVGEVEDTMGELEIVWFNPDEPYDEVRIFRTRAEGGRFVFQNLQLPGEVWVTHVAFRKTGQPGEALQFGLMSEADIDIGHALCPMARPFPLVGSVHVIE